MVLDGKKRMMEVAQPLRRLIIEVDMGDLGPPGQRGDINTKAVVLGGDFNLSGRHIHDRVIAAVVAELEFKGCAPQRQAQNLMTQTNPEYRDLADQGGHTVFGVRHRVRISRAV